MDQFIASKSESLLNAIILHHRFYVLSLGVNIQTEKIFDELMSLHKDTFLSLNTNFRWLKEIQMGCFEVQKNESSGRSISTSNAANVRKVKGLIDKNCRFSYYELESIKGIPKKNCP